MSKIKKCFPGGKYKAVTMSFDDGRIYDKRLIDIFNKYGIKGTFHLNSGIDTEEKIKKYGPRVSLNEISKVYAGHEIASHTVNHFSLLDHTEEEVEFEITEDRKNLEKYSNKIVNGFSYPYGDYNEDIIKILKKSGIKYARTINDSETFDLPLDFYKWNCTCRHRSHKLFKLCEKFLEIKNHELQLFYLWGHSYEFNYDNNWDVIENFCKKIGMCDDIWYATNIEVADYIEVVNNLRFSVNKDIVYNPSYNSAYISVNDKIYMIKGGETLSF